MAMTKLIKLGPKSIENFKINQKRLDSNQKCIDIINIIENFHMVLKLEYDFEPDRYSPSKL